MPSLASPRHTARRVLVGVVAAALIAIVLGETIHDVVRSSGPAKLRQLRSWEAVASPIVVEENALTGTLLGFRATAPSGSRAHADGELDLLETVTARERNALQSITLGPPTTEAGTLLSEVVVDRANASRAIASGYDAATAPARNAQEAAAEFRSAGSDLAAGDAAYRHLLSLLRAAGGRGLFPAHSVWDLDGAAWSARAGTFAAALADAPQLVAHAALELVAVAVVPTPDHITGLPTPTTTTTSTTTTTTTTTTVPTGPSGASGPSGVGGVFGVSGATGATGTVAASTTSSSTTTTTVAIPRLPQIVPPGAVADLYPTRTIAVEAIVRNSGNVALDGVACVATLTPLGAGSSTASVLASTVPLGVVDPGRARYVNVPTFTLPETVRHFLLRVEVEAHGLAGVARTFTLAIAS